MNVNADIFCCTAVFIVKHYSPLLRSNFFLITQKNPFYKKFNVKSKSFEKPTKTIKLNLSDNAHHVGAGYTDKKENKIFLI